MVEFILKGTIKSKGDCHRYWHQCDRTALLRYPSWKFLRVSTQNASKNHPEGSTGGSPHQQKTQVMFQVSGLLAKPFPVSGLTAESLCISGKFYCILGILPHRLCTLTWEELDPTPSKVHSGVQILFMPHPPNNQAFSEKGRVFSALTILSTAGAQEICSKCVQTWKRATGFQG